MKFACNAANCAEWTASAHAGARFAGAIRGMQPPEYCAIPAPKSTRPPVALLDTLCRLWDNFSNQRVPCGPIPRMAGCT